MEYAKILQQSAGKSDYRESPLKTVMKVNELKKTINKDGRANIIKQEPYANKIATYLSKEELKRKTNEGARQYLSGVRQYYNDIALKALGSSQNQEDQTTYLKEARKQTQQMKLLNDPSQVEYLKKVDPLGLFYLEKSLEVQNQKVQDAMADPTGDNLRNLLRGFPLNVPSDLSSEPDSVFTHGLDSLRSRTQFQLTEDARNALDRAVRSGEPDRPIIEGDYLHDSELPIHQQHSEELMAENPILEPPEAFREARDNIIDARPLAQELQQQLQQQEQQQLLAAQESPISLRSSWMAEGEDVPSNVPLKIDMVPSSKILNKITTKDTLVKIATRFRVPYNDSDSVDTIRQKLKDWRKLQKRMESYGSTPVEFPSRLLKEYKLDEEEIDDYIDKYGVSRDEAISTLLKRKEGKPKQDKERPIKQSDEIFFSPDIFDSTRKKMIAYKLSELEKLEPYGLRSVAISKGIDYRGKTKEQIISEIQDKSKGKSKGKGFRPLSSYPPHIIAGALHIVKQRKKNRLNQNEYNREQAYHLTQNAIH